MNLVDLNPKAEGSEPFSRDRTRFVTDESGCYVLTTVTGHILYIGLATSIRNRFGQHLDNPTKVSPTTEGRAANFSWLRAENLELIERSWLNQHRVMEGRLPILNKLDSPVSY